MRKAILAAASIGVVLWISPAIAETKQVSAFVAHKGIGFSIQDEKTGAVTAFDPVSALDDRQSTVANCSQFKAELKGVTWCFVNAENLQTFTKATKKRTFSQTGVVQELNEYLPAVGGWCAWGQSNTNFAEGDPRTSFVFEGKLIVNGSHEVADKFKLNPTLRLPLAIMNYRLSTAEREVTIVPNKAVTN